MSEASDLEAATEYVIRFPLTNNVEKAIRGDGFLAGLKHARREMEGEIGELREALEFYAEDDQFTPSHKRDMMDDYGSTAREVLKKYGSKE